MFTCFHESIWYATRRNGTFIAGGAIDTLNFFEDIFKIRDLDVKFLEHTSKKYKEL